MKFLYLRAVALVLILLAYFPNYASVVQSADIRYECVGTNSYKVILTVSQDAGGVGLATNQQIRYQSLACGIDALLDLQANGPVQGNNPSETCPQAGAVSSEIIQFEGLLNLPPCNLGTDWLLSWELCCRNPNLSTLTAPESQVIYVDASLDQTLAVCNSSPEIEFPSQLTICQGQTETLSFQAFDADGDQLNYILSNCSQAPGVSVDYAGPFSGFFPLISSPAPVVNSFTGLFSVTAVIPAQTVLCITVEELRNNVKIGEITREVELLVVDCSGTNPPSLSGINNSDPSQASNFSLDLCVGQETCFDLGIFGAPNANASLLTSTLPGNATFSLSGDGTPSPTGQFCWTPTSSDLGSQYFTVLLEDESCPYNRYRYETYTLEVIDPGYSVSIADPGSLCVGDNAVLDATINSNGGSIQTISWSPSSGLNNPAIEDPTASPIVSTLYTVAVTFADGCQAFNSVLVNVESNPTVSIDPAVAVGCAAAPASLNASVSAPSGIANYQWSTGQSGPTLSTIQVGPGVTTSYSVTITDNNGCIATSSTQVLVGEQANCEIIYAGPNATAGNGTGTINNPFELQEAIDQLVCSGGTIRLLRGTYNRSTAVVIGNNVTLDGGFDNNGTKTSQPGATIIRRNTTGNDGPNLSPALIAVRAANASGFRLQDLQLETLDAPDNVFVAVSTYGLYLDNCSDYDIVRTQILAGDGSKGRDGQNGVAGANGQDGGDGANGFGDDNDEEQNGGFGGDGAGSGGGDGAIDAFLNGCTMDDAVSDIFGCNGCTVGCTGLPGDDANNTTSGSGGGGGGGGGQQNRNGGPGGSAGDVPNGPTGPNFPGVSTGNNCRTSGLWGGQSAACNGCGLFSNCDPTEVSTHSGACGRDGFDGTPGVSGTNTPSGSQSGGFYIPGAQAESGTRGTGGTGGAGGGGGAGQGSATCSDGSGASGGGGGGGGEAGFAGQGGFGGGGSFAIYLNQNGQNGRFTQSFAQAGAAGLGGDGGNGGNGGIGGGGGIGGDGTPAADPEVGFGGDGGNGGQGGQGGSGADGADGLALQLFVNGNSPSNTDINFNLSAMATITWDGTNCTNTNVFFTGAGVSSPQQFNSTNGSDRENITGSSGTYFGFIDISSENQIPELEANTGFVNSSLYRICENEIVNFTVNNPSPGTNYSWTFNGPNGVNPVAANISNDPNATSVENVFFSVAGTYTVDLQFDTDCCGSSVVSSISVEVEHLPEIDIDDEKICSGGSGVSLDASMTTAYGQNFQGGTNDNWTFSWSPAAGLNTTSGSMVIANPAQTTTYTVTAVNSNGRCPVSTQVTVELEDFDDVLINNPVPDACNNGGFLTLSLPTGVGNYNYQWENENGDPIAGTFLVPNLSAGTYFLTLTDQTTGCIFESSAVVAAVGGIDAYVQNVVAPNCPGFADGSATVGDWNLTNPITVQWPASAGNQTGITASNLSPGNYDVTITDSNNTTCFDVVQVQIPSGITLEANIIEAIDVDCPALGSLTASGEFGSGNYLYNWNTGQSGPTITGLDAGTYTVNIIDTNNPGCLASTSFTIQDVSNPGPIAAGTGLSNELNFGQGCGGANPSVNLGNPFLEPVNNDCVPTGSVTNACGTLDLSQNPVYYTVQTNVPGNPDDDLNLAILAPSSGTISMMEAALYGPVNPACPQLSGGSFVDCSSTNDPSTGLQLSVPSGGDGQVFIIIVDTDGTGTFAIQGTVPNPLPLELVAFDGRKLEDQSHLLSWTTQLEVGVSHFQLERSDDSRTFETLGSKQEARNLLDVQEYEQIDAQPLIGPNYYRLQMVDFDGSMAYSPIILLDRKLEIGDEGIQITPNPTMSISWLRIDNPIQGNLEFTVYNAIGQKIIHDQVNLKPGLHQFPIDLTEQADGTYWIQVQLESYRKALKLVKVNP